MQSSMLLSRPTNKQRLAKPVTQSDIHGCSPWSQGGGPFYSQKKNTSLYAGASEPSAQLSLIEKVSPSLGPWHMLLCMPQSNRESSLSKRGAQ